MTRWAGEFPCCSEWEGDREKIEDLVRFQEKSGCFKTVDHVSVSFSEGEMQEIPALVWAFLVVQ